jgi:hypothetical protein
MKKKGLDNYIKVGRISMSVSKKANIMSADICIDSNHIIHIGNEHKKELQQLGITALDFVKIIATSFNRIYQDKKTKALYLVLYTDKKSAKSAVIELNFAGKLRWWEIKTATPIRIAFFETKNLIYIKSAPRL